jgi:hypothetical protein
LNIDNFFPSITLGGANSRPSPQRNMSRLPIILLLLFLLFTAFLILLVILLLHFLFFFRTSNNLTISLTKLNVDITWRYAVSYSPSTSSSYLAALDFSTAAK